MLFVTESWQSGNAPDSKSGEPSFSLARRFKSCTLLKLTSLQYQLLQAFILFLQGIKMIKSSFTKIALYCFSYLVDLNIFNIIALITFNQTYNVRLYIFLSSFFNVIRNLMDSDIRK